MKRGAANPEKSGKMLKVSSAKQKINLAVNFDV